MLKTTQFDRYKILLYQQCDSQSAISPKQHWKSGGQKKKQHLQWVDSV